MPPSHETDKPGTFGVASLPELLTNPAADDLFLPASRAGVMSAWWGHVPFAHWLVGALRPRVIVELGTHNGASYAAFCEAVQRGGISARCYAVDTWEGDEHAGHYGEDVFQNLAAFNRSRYHAFSELLRTTFDSALDYFADGTIDLLHIDGLHTYEAVRQDFENWRPKLSTRGVVLFHDINVRERDFGVWRLWQELQARYPNFEFAHSHGLGLAVIGEEVPPGLVELLSLPPESAARVRSRFAQLGARWVEADMAERHAANAAGLGGHAARLENSLAEYQQRVATLEKEVASLEARLAEYARHTAALEVGLTSRTHDLDEQRRHTTALEAELAARLQTLDQQRQDAAALEAEWTARLQTLDQQRQDACSALEAALTTAREEAVTALLSHEEALRKGENLAGQLAYQVSARDETIESQAAEIANQSFSIAHLHSVVDAQRQELQAVTDQARDAEEMAHRLSVHLEAVRISASWRAMGPYRIARRSIRRLLSGRLASRDLAIPSAAPIPSLPPPEPVHLEAEPTPAALTRSPEAEVIAASGLFDEAFYAGTEAAQATSLDPAYHYLTVGEPAGLRPSERFDPNFYRERYPDIAATGMSSLLHYVLDGQREGRVPLPTAEALEYPTQGLRPQRETVLVIIHEATRTGAAILGWNIVVELERRYNVVVLLKRGGAIEAAIAEASSAVVTLPDDFVLDEVEIRILIRNLVAHYAPLYAIANSAETRYFVPALESSGVPVVSLIHEFSTNIRPLGAMHELFRSASRIVFSAQITAASSLTDYRSLEARTYEVLPQGAPRLPVSALEEASQDDVGKEVAAKAAARLAKLPGDDTFLVIGVGTITIRKGVDIFIAAAASALRRANGTKLAFAWVGEAYWFDEAYRDYLKEQVRRSGIEASFHFLGEFEDLEPVYARADALLMSSRLDPLPNVGIDAIVRGIPVVCFDEASGIAEMLQGSDTLRELVVPHLDAGAAADVILKLARDPEQLEVRKGALRDFARQHFDMERYVTTLDRLGQDAAAAVTRRARDRDVILLHNCFNRRLYLGPRDSDATAAQAVEHYLHASQLVMPRNRPRAGGLLRRPMEGFNPLVYASANPHYDEAAGEDPLAHYLRTGRPEGRWAHAVIRPDDRRADMGIPLRVAVHGHFHYPELFDDFITRLRANRTAFDLFLTTTKEEAAQFLRERIEVLGLSNASVALVPNRGRDIGPMLTGSTAERLAGYDIVGHFHGKRSVHVDAAIGSGWRNFLWEHLIGAEHLMMDAVMAAFVADPGLGLVFPEDPHLNDWDDNRIFAEEIAARMGLALPNHFDFPQGTMFWARAKALRPLQDLRLDWEDYPAEPLPIDGSMLHAMERMVPFSTSSVGFRYATTHVPSWVR